MPAKTTQQSSPQHWLPNLKAGWDIIPLETIAAKPQTDYEFAAFTLQLGPVLQLWLQ